MYDEFSCAAASWSQPWRVIVKAEVMAAGDNPRFVVTSLEAPTPQRVYEELYCARGNGENDIKAVKCDLQSDRTSATTFLANAMRLCSRALPTSSTMPSAPTRWRTPHWPLRNPPR